MVVRLDVPHSDDLALHVCITTQRMDHASPFKLILVLAVSLFRHQVLCMCFFLGQYEEISIYLK